MEVGAGTFHPATTLRALGPEALARRLCAAVAPAEGRALRREPQPAAALLPVPGDPEAVARRRSGPLSREPRSRSASIPQRHDIRFVEDDWESPTLGAWGLGWEVWCDGMEVTPVHLFPAGRRLRLRSGLGGAHLWARAARHVCAGRRERLRPEVQRALSATATCFIRPSANIPPIISSTPIPRFCSAISPTPKRNAASLLAAKSGASRLRPVHEGEPPSTCWMRAASSA